MKRRNILSFGLGILATIPFSDRFSRLVVRADQPLKEFTDKPPYGFVPPHRPCITPGTGKVGRKLGHKK